MRFGWIMLAWSCGLVFSAPAPRNTNVTIMLVSGEQLAGRLIQYVGGEFVIEEAGGQRLAVDASAVRAVIMGRARGGFLNPSRGGGYPVKKSPPDDRVKAPEEPPPPSSASNRGSERIDRLFKELEALPFERIPILERGGKIVEEIIAEATRTNQKEKVLKRFDDKAEKEAKNDAEKVRWLMFASMAHFRAGDARIARDLRGQAIEVAREMPGDMRWLRPPLGGGRRRRPFR